MKRKKNETTQKVDTAGTKCVVKLMELNILWNIL